MTEQERAAVIKALEASRLSISAALVILSAPIASGPVPAGGGEAPAACHCGSSAKPIQRSVFGPGADQKMCPTCGAER